MNTPTKPVKSLCKRPARAVALVPVTLTADESTWLHAYRAMDLRRRGELLRHAESQARKHPMVRTLAAAPAQTGIRLVANAGKRVAA